ncbi:MAG: hypothetical protein QM791_03625 [Ferruginibacter sp.]
MSAADSSIPVVYLSYIPYGTDLLRNFLASYVNNAAGCPHQLIILFKGMMREGDEAPFISVAEEFGVQFQSMYYYGGGMDLDAYLFAARELTSRFVFFLNSQSVLLHGNWLLKMAQYTGESSTGVVASSASAQSHYSAVFINHSWRLNFSSGIKNQFRKYKLLVKAFFYWRSLFPAFPNLHFRTTGFLINRELFTSLNIPVAANKMQAYKIESGYNSITRQVVAQGYTIILVDKNGKAYPMNEWHKPVVFWKGEQEDLLIADKQTMLFLNASPAEKKLFTLNAWGKP